ncbi:amidohydrolase [uncultured Paracoccus sp.]|uniref:amidohydrolase n=1 Tax=uncultured Paracoccus sp. TaxID=189685 RepID=UPI0026033EA6|nr:amidohydrolase [uncultured Paracoccus sp.]
MTKAIRVLRARKIVTMNGYLPEATHVAISDGRILGVGGPEVLETFGTADLDDSFAGKVLMPGFVEGHCHAKEGGMWDFLYVGFLPRHDPDGKLWPGADSMEAVVSRLREASDAMEDREAPLYAWGFDPIYFDGVRMSLADINRVSDTRPIVVMHSNGHVINVNSVVLDRAGIGRETNVHGVIKDPYGDPTGELAETAAKYMVFRVTGDPFFAGVRAKDLARFAQSAANCGVTTATDLFATFSDESLEAYRTATAAPDYPLRVLPAMNVIDRPPEEGIAVLRAAMKGNTDKLIFGLCKVMTDGSIQGMSARMKWPGYHNGAPNGVWNLAPEQLTEIVLAYHAAGVHLHMHVNGDEASELMLDAIEAALIAAPRPDHRHTLQHCQMADEAQFRRMKALGLCVNLFSNHIYYWGDQHREITMGPDRAARMDACATAERLGVPFAIHSDAPVTPLGPLFTAWCAVNRLTATGRVLGPRERISVDSALHAITLGAAYTIGMDHLVGSIEPGKFADFAVLESDPRQIEPQALRDVVVWGTIVGGVPQRAAGRDD